MSNDSPVIPAALSLLKTIPETWSEFDPDSLTAAQEEAVGYLCRAELVEVRTTARWSHVGHPVTFEITTVCSGETYTEEESNRLVAPLYAEWKFAWGEWEAQATGCPVRCDVVGCRRWRLTAQGVIARGEVLAGDAGYCIDWIFHRSTRFTPGKLVKGRLTVERLERLGAPAGPAPVTIENWPAGGAALADALRQTLGDLLSAGKLRDEDDRDYVLVSELLRNDPRFDTAGKCSRFLDAHKDEIRQKKPAPNRRKVHAGDWHAYWRKHDRMRDQLDGQTAEEVAAAVNTRKAREDSKKHGR